MFRFFFIKQNIYFVVEYMFLLCYAFKHSRAIERDENG